MKKPKRRGHGPKRGPAGQYFTFGPWRFDIDRANRLAGNTAKYRIEQRRPAPDWVGPNIEVNEAAIEGADLSRPVVFATAVMDGQPFRLLIDGNHRVLKAVRHQLPVSLVVLDLEDTLKVLSAPASTLRQMRADGQRLGLLRPGG